MLLRLYKVLRYIIHLNNKIYLHYNIYIITLRNDLVKY